MNEHERMSKILSLTNTFRMFGTPGEVSKVVTGRRIGEDAGLVLTERFTLAELSILFLSLSSALSTIPYGTQAMMDPLAFELWITLRTILLRHQRAEGEGGPETNGQKAQA